MGRGGDGGGRGGGARFVDGVEVLKDGTEPHPASFCLAEAELRLAGADDPAFTALKAQYPDVLGEAPPGMPPDRGLERELETGDAAAVAAGETPV